MAYKKNVITYCSKSYPEQYFFTIQPSPNWIFFRKFVRYIFDNTSL